MKHVKTLQNSPSLLAGRYYTETPHPGRKPDLAFLLHLGNLRCHGEVASRPRCRWGLGRTGDFLVLLSRAQLLNLTATVGDVGRTDYGFICQTGSRPADGTLPAAGMDGAATPVVRGLREGPERKKISSKSWAIKAKKLGLGCAIRPLFFRWASHVTSS